MKQDAPAIFPITALIRGKGQPVDGILFEAARTLQSRGLRVAGVAQETRARGRECCDEFSLVDFTTGNRHCISQDLGRGSKGCRLNYETMAATLVEIGRGIATRPDAVILNRFGYSETQGGGFRPLIEQALALEIPILLSVTRSYFNDWSTYADGFAVNRPAVPATVQEWCEDIMRISVPSQEHA